MNIINTELEVLNKTLQDAISTLPSGISEYLQKFIFSPSKRIRPSLVFFVANAMNMKISNKIYSLAAAVEILHNATLIHDDIIDNANIRRGQVSLNVSLGNSLSVLYGDILLSVAMKLIYSLNNLEVFNIFSIVLNKMCQGEINQHFSLGKIPSFEDYIEKSKNKTAQLFIAALKSLCLIENIKEIDKITDFALNFGIAFQLKDDLLNIIKTDKLKPELNDIYNGIYTLPVILWAEKNNCISVPEKEKLPDIILSDTDSIEKTKNIIRNYSNKAVNAIEFIKDNKYKPKLIEITTNLSQF